MDEDLTDDFSDQEQGDGAQEDDRDAEELQADLKGYHDDDGGEAQFVAD